MMKRIKGTFQAISWNGRTIAFSFMFGLQGDEVKAISKLSAKRLRYRLVLYFPSEDRRILLYDNFRCEEPHIYIGESKEKIPYAFRDVKKLLEDFADDVELATGIDIYDWVKEVERLLSENPFYHLFFQENIGG